MNWGGLCGSCSLVLAIVAIIALDHHEDKVFAFGMWVLDRIFGREGEE